MQCLQSQKNGPIFTTSTCVRLCLCVSLPLSLFPCVYPCPARMPLQVCVCVCVCVCVSEGVPVSSVDAATGVSVCLSVCVCVRESVCVGVPVPSADAATGVCAYVCMGGWVYPCPARMPLQNLLTSALHPSAWVPVWRLWCVGLCPGAGTFGLRV